MLLEVKLNMTDKEIEMTLEEIMAEVQHEARTGFNTLLQNLLTYDELGIEVRVFKVLNSRGELVDYKIRNTNGKDIQL